jgi:hypothetical protein
MSAFEKYAIGSRAASRAGAFAGRACDAEPDYFLAHRTWLGLVIS